ncbi:hypothetical protein QYF61_007823 [Mycteria americana]|uniref:Uncharacterized protein n=1 Tax=Mycteria americana TaxID=33587 RepID=A0AAN7NM10_MYCAM|nr:hypothetical protein QYF61_007823 [Mycteria americana]
MTESGLVSTSATKGRIPSGPIDSTASQGTLVNQSPKQAKVCPPEVQGSSSAEPLPYFSKNQKLCHFVIAVPKTASNHHITHKSFSVHKQEVQRGTFPRWLAHQLCQEAICHTLQEPPSLFPLCCILRCPSLDMRQHINVSLVVSGPDTSQDAIGFLGHLGTLLAHVQPAVNQHPQVLCWAAFQPLFPKPVVLHGVVVAQVQDLTLRLVEPHTVGPSPSIQPVQVPLQSLPTLKQINTPAQLGVICKLTERALNPFIQIIDKDIEQNWPQHRALGDTACDRPPTEVNSIHHHPLGPAIQPVLYPAKSAPVQAMSSQFLQENAVGNGVKGFTEV